MNMAIAILVVFLGVGMLRGNVVTAEDKPMGLPSVAEKIQQGEFDVGGRADKAFGMTQDQRFHRIHTRVLGLECGTCHVNKVPLSVEMFAISPAVDVPAAALGPVDRRTCVGCHVAGPGRKFYGPPAR
jgi:hypothetical protein